MANRLTFNGGLEDKWTESFDRIVEGCMSDDVCVILGANIRKRRKSRGWTLDHLGAELGVSYQQLQKYEKGTNRMPVNMLVHLAGLFQCSLDELCGVRDPASDAALVALLERISAMRSPGLCRKVLALIEELVDIEKAA